ncbi:PD-(D/E)XK nuclease family protein [Mobiluncus porci]|uniref:DNA helicase UvrD n=1 Tax=Mobiluncus porci TaxID=2652278 RepID=A0A7K0K2W7_9ACTO|nr:PD-(D/E)XK nuclease family protein [Mobiluncus porci]MST49385.1 DNA helicase UvrD [Mobiluncus porci]
MNGETMNFESVWGLLERTLNREKPELGGFAPLLAALESGASVLVAGRPASGKTTLLAALLVNNPETLVLCGNGKAAQALNNQALKMRSWGDGEGGSLGICKSFSSEIFARLNAWRESQKLPPARLATDAELFAEVKEFLSHLEVGEDLRPALETQGFLKDLLDGLFRVRSLGTNAGLKKVHPLVRQLIEMMRKDRLEKRRQAREEAWPLDTASLFEEYLRALEDGAPVPVFVGLDDWQNANGLMTEIVLAWARLGTQVVAMTSPQTSVNTYRGGTEKAWEELKRGLETIPGREVTEILLTQMFAPKGLRRLWKTVISRMGVHGIGTRLWAPVEEDKELEVPPGEELDIGSEVILVQETSDSDQFREIARILQEKHIFSETEVPYENMAVLTRTMSDAKTIVEVLGMMGIPASIPGSTEQLNEGRMTYWLLTMMQAVCSDLPLAQSAGKLDLLDLLRSALIGFDTWKIRNLESKLGDFALLSISEGVTGGKTEEAKGNSTTNLEKDSAEEEFSASEMLGFTRAFWRVTLSGSQFFGRTPEEIVGLFPDAEIVVRIAGALRNAREEWKREPESVQVILWKIWNGIGRGEDLRDLALSSTLDWQVRKLIQLDLDLVMDLVKAADWFEARNPGRNAGDFARSMLERDLPTGTVAPHHLSPGAVTVTTSSSAVSKHWDIVAVAGLTEGNWPSLRWPGSLLGTTMFELESSEETERENGKSGQIGFQWGWQNEFKNFFAAITRTSGTLILATSEGNGVSPSPFLLPLVRALHLKASGEKISRLPSNLRDFTAHLRALTMKGEMPHTPHQEVKAGVEGNETPIGDDAVEAASLLATLGARGYAPAQPKNWLGVLSSPLGSKAREVRVRASSFERALRNPLDYILGWSGFADEEEDNLAANNAGTIVHEAARIVGERYWLDGSEIRDDLTVEEILDELEKEVAKMLPVPDTASGDNFRRKVMVCLPPLANFLVENQYPSLFEYSCFGRIPNRENTGAITYAASIDRVIFRPEGTLIVDYKTGTPLQFTVMNVAANLQLMLYQKAFNDSKEGKKRPCRGAAIVTLKHPPKSPFTEPILRELSYGMLLQPGDWETEIELPDPFTAQHRQLLEDPEAWLAGDKAGEGDPEWMTMGAYLQDRVDLAVKAFGGPQLARLQFPDQWASTDTLNLEVQGR